MKLTKIVSLEYKTKQDKKRAEETFELFKSIDGAKMKDWPVKKKEEKMSKIVCLALFILMTFSFGYAKDLKLAEVENLKLKNLNHRIKDIQQEYDKTLAIIQRNANRLFAPINAERKELVDSIEKRLKAKLTDYTLKNDGTLVLIPKKETEEIAREEE